MIPWRLMVRLVGGHLVQWVTLVFASAAGLIVLVGGVEAAGLGQQAALTVALAGAPGLVVVLSPALVGLGVALASARMAALGEQRALAIAGVPPGQALIGVVLLGVFVGGAQWLCADRLVWRAEAWRRALRPSPAEAVEWVWLPEGAYRTADGTLVRLTDGVIDRDAPIVRNAPISAAAVAAGRMRQQPQSASGAALRTTLLESARLERHHRPARGLACVALGVIGWIRGGRGGMWGVGAALAIALGWQGVDALVYAASAQGRLSVMAGAWSGALLVAGLAVGGAWRARR